MERPVAHAAGAPIPSSSNGAARAEADLLAGVAGGRRHRPQAHVRPQDLVVRLRVESSTPFRLRPQPCTCQSRHTLPSPSRAAPPTAPRLCTARGARQAPGRPGRPRRPSSAPPTAPRSPSASCRAHSSRCRRPAARSPRLRGSSARHCGPLPRSGQARRGSGCQRGGPKPRRGDESALGPVALRRARRARPNPARGPPARA